MNYNEKNRGAKNLWHTVAGPYEPEIYHLNEEETVLSFETKGKIISASGNDCAVCPRYTAYPYEKTEEELCRSAELWMKIGYRDHIATNEEIACSGCKPEKWCRYQVFKCKPAGNLTHAGTGKTVTTFDNRNPSENLYASSLQRQNQVDGVTAKRAFGKEH